MSKRWQGIASGVAVGACLMFMESESPGAFGRAIAKFGDIIVPASAETVAVVVDTGQAVSDEAQRQGLNPGAVFSNPNAAEGTLNPRDVSELPPLEGIPNQAGG